MHDQEIPEFDPEAGIESNASVLYGVLGLMPSRFQRQYRSFRTQGLSDRWGYGVSVSVENVDFVLLLHFIRLLKDKKGFRPVAKKRLIKAYCGPEICDTGSEHDLAEYVRPLLRENSQVRFELTNARER